MTSIKRVAYAYNSILEAEGKEAYFLDVLDCEDSEMLVDVHQGFRTKKEFLEAIKGLLPMICGGEDVG